MNSIYEVYITAGAPIVKMVSDRLEVAIADQNPIVLSHEPVINFETFCRHIRYRHGTLASRNYRFAKRVYGVSIGLCVVGVEAECDYRSS